MKLSAIIERWNGYVDAETVIANEARSFGGQAARNTASMSLARADTWKRAIAELQAEQQSTFDECSTCGYDPCMCDQQ